MMYLKILNQLFFTYLCVNSLKHDAGILAFSDAFSKLFPKAFY